MRTALSQQLISFNFINFSLSFHFKSEIVLGMSHEEEATSPDCSESPAFLSPQSNNLMYDQHSSEEELEVIMTKPIELDNNLIEMANENVNHHHHHHHNHHQSQKNKLSSEGEISPKRCSSEKRKRSLAHNSDDEVILTVVLTVFLDLLLPEFH
jgi:hypothetical protein